MEGLKVPTRRERNRAWVELFGGLSKSLNNQRRQQREL